MSISPEINGRLGREEPDAEEGTDEGKENGRDYGTDEGRDEGADEGRNEATDEGRNDGRYAGGSGEDRQVRRKDIRYVMAKISLNIIS